MVNEMYKMKAFILSLIILSGYSHAEDASVQVGFSPEGSAHVLVLGAINSAKKTIRMMAYSFTAPDIMKALVDAKKRGVDVKIVIDERGNRDRSSIYAMNYVVSNGIQLRTDSDFPIQHDKSIVIDNGSVETGSFNFTKSAETRNSENAIVIWNMPKLAHSYTEHWQDRWDRGQDYRP